MGNTNKLMKGLGSGDVSWQDDFRLTDNNQINDLFKVELDNGDVTANGVISANAGVIGNLTGNVTGAVTGGITGNVVGNVTGNLTGNVTGNVVGNLTGNVTGNVSGTAASITGNLTGDVTSVGMATTVASVAASTAANVHTAELLANAATNANTASAIVKRDASGNFTAGTVTAALTGNVTGSASAVGGITVTGTPSIGYLPTATSSSAATWQAPAAPVMPSGSVVACTMTETGAVVSTTGTFAVVMDTDNIPQISSGTEVMTHSFTPSSASNILFIEVGAHMTNNSSRRMLVALFQDAVANALAAQDVANSLSTVGSKGIIQHKMVAGTTSAITFRVRIGDDSGANTTLNGTAGARRYGGVANSYIKVTEVKA